LVAIVWIHVWIVRIHVRIDIGWILYARIVIIGITVWMISLPLIVIIGKRIVIVTRVCIIHWITIVRYACTEPIILVASVVRFSTVMRLRGSYYYQDPQYQDY